MSRGERTNFPEHTTEAHPLDAMGHEHPVLGRVSRSEAKYVPFAWDTRKHQHLLVAGDGGAGKTVLARGIAQQWAGRVLVIGHDCEWDVRRYRVQSDVPENLNAAIECLNAVTSQDSRQGRLLVVVDGLDDYVMRYPASAKDGFQVGVVLRNLAALPGVHLLVTAHHQRTVAWATGLRIYASRTTKHRMHVQDAAGGAIEITVPFVGSPGYESRHPHPVVGGQPLCSSCVSASDQQEQAIPRSPAGRWRSWTRGLRT